MHVNALYDIKPAFISATVSDQTDKISKTQLVHAPAHTCAI